jgi:ribonuclease P protein component
LIGRVRGRASFERIAQTGSRVRAGVLWCTFVLDPLVSPPQVAYAVGRAVGTAVTRNRLRRRLRSLLVQQYPHLPGGLYLIGATPDAARQSFDELAFDLSRLMDRIPSTSHA